MDTQRGRALALDLGTRRIGVAISDDRRTFAVPLATIQAIPRTRALDTIVALVHERDIADLVIGLPLTLRGEIGPQAKVVQEFTHELEQLLNRSPQSPSLHFFDERFTSAAANQLMRELGLSPEKRREKVDEIAATLILQDFLDAKNQALSTEP